MASIEEMEIKIDLDKLELAIKNNNLKDFIIGIRGYGIYQNSNGEMVKNPVRQVQALYNYKKKYPNFDLETLLKNTLLSISRNSKSILGLCRVLDIVENMHYFEKRNESTFKIEINDILEEVRNNIIKNESIYRDAESSELHMLDYHNGKIERDHGQKLF